MRKITEITKNKQRDVQLIYGRDVTCNCSIAAQSCGHSSKVVLDGHCHWDHPLMILYSNPNPDSNSVNLVFETNLLSSARHCSLVHYSQLNHFNSQQIQSRTFASQECCISREDFHAGPGPH